MKMSRLIALKPHKYGTRQLSADDEYEAPFREAVAHDATKKARFDKTKREGEGVDPTVLESSAVEPEPQPQPELSLNELRLQATQLGINIDGRWGAHRLQYEIDKVRQR